MTNDLSNVYPRKHVDFIVGKDGEFAVEPFEFTVESDEQTWPTIEARQAEIFAAGAESANTCNLRTLLDLDGYRE